MKNKTREISNAVSNMKTSVLTFANHVSVGFKKPQKKFIADMLYGMMCSQDVKLTKVAESLKEEYKLKHTEERLRRNANDFNECEKIADNYMQKVVRKTRSDTLLLVDDGDISKPYGSNFEGLCEVRDGSTGKIGKGFPTVGIIALTDDKLPVPVYENIYSYTQNFVSENHETFKALDFADKHFSKENIRVFDRGYDSNIITEKLLETKVRFIVRVNDDVRTVIHNGKKINIGELATKFKGKYALDYTNQKDKKKHCKISVTQIELPKFPGKIFNLVICNGFSNKPMLLITNVFDDDNAICKTIVKCYLLRWKIEEFYRFKKQTFKFEDIRVMSLKAMNNINLLLNILIGFLSMKSTEGQDKPIIVVLVNQVKRIYEPKNILYSVCAGLMVIMMIAGIGWRSPPDQTSGYVQISLVENFIGS
jgi:hypothetical protein